ncbi:MAG: type VI secretion system tip protein TssI/VgrG [Polyangiaceae bacterium]
MADEEVIYFRLHGPELPEDAVVHEYRAVEQMSSPYRVDVIFSSLDGGFEVDRMLRTQATLEVVDESGGQRFFDGVVDRAEFVDSIESRLYFRIRIRPALAALAHRFNCRIFQDKNILAIMQTIFDESGFGDKVEFKHTKDYPSLEFVVQYRESELNFVHRLMEDHGLFYWFGHRADGHTMVITDDATMLGKQDDTPETMFSMTQGAAGDTQPLTDFSRRRRLRTNNIHVRDYNFEKPQVPPSSDLPAEEAWSMSYFEYPGGFSDALGANLKASARLRELRHDADTVSGKSRAIGMRVGVPFSVEGATEPDLNGIFVTTRLQTHGHQRLDQGENVACANEFEGIVKDAPYAVPRRARRPRITGVQTAVVTGSSEQDQALHVDEYGRIKVRFRWDREGQQDHTASCWIRVSQTGQGGSMSLPRVGWEVAVAFLEGDPDRPMVLGRLYNAEKTPPMTLPAAKTSGSLKSWSSPGAGGYNELSVGDAGGSQGFNIHAQKDLNVTIGNDKNETVDVDESHHVSCNESSTVGSDESIQVAGDQSLNVGANLTQNIGGSQTISISGNDTSNATANYVEKIDGDRSYKVSGNQITIENGIRYEVTGDMTKKVGSAQLNGSIASIQETVTGNYTHNTSAVTVHLCKGDHGEAISGSKTQTSIAAELHMTKANLEQSCDAAVTNLVGGLHYQKLDGDLIIKAPIVTMLGATGQLKGGSSTLKLGGGPIVAKGSKISVKSLSIIKMSTSLKMG